MRSVLWCQHNKCFDNLEGGKYCSTMITFKLINNTQYTDYEGVCFWIQFSWSSFLQFLSPLKFAFFFTVVINQQLDYFFAISAVFGVDSRETGRAGEKQQRAWAWIWTQVTAGRTALTGGTQSAGELQVSPINQQWFNGIPLLWLGQGCRPPLIRPQPHALSKHSPLQTGRSDTCRGNLILVNSWCEVDQLNVEYEKKKKKKTADDTRLRGWHRQLAPQTTGNLPHPSLPCPRSGRNPPCNTPPSSLGHPGHVSVCSFQQQTRWRCCMLQPVSLGVECIIKLGQSWSDWLLFILVCVLCCGRHHI